MGVNLAVAAAIEAGFEGDHLIEAVAIAGAESRWVHTAENSRSSATGLWQIAYDVWKNTLASAGILPSRHRRSDLHNPYVNAHAAKLITEQPLALQHGMWSDWAVHPDSMSRGFYTPKNDYSSFLEEAHKAVVRVLEKSNINIGEGTSGLPRGVRIENGEVIVSKRDEDNGGAHCS